MWDFSFFYEAAECYIHGQSPYECARFLYPLPTLFLILPLTAFSLPVAKAFWGLAMLASLVATCKRRAVWYALYVPVLQSFWLGQIDLVLLSAVFVATGPAIALLTLKPQLVWIYLPVWFLSVDWKERRNFAITVSALWGASLLAYPKWPIEFFQTTGNLRETAYTSPSLWAGDFLPWWLVIVIGVVLIARSKDKWAATMAVNPAIISYDLVVLLPRARWWLVPLSWLTQLFSNWAGMAAPHVILSIAKSLM
jgi:hypothetical protein